MHSGDGGAAAPERWQQIVTDVCEARGVALHAVVSGDRRRAVSEARAEVFYRLKRERPRLSWAKIGQLIGGFDATTVLYGYRRHAERLLAKKAPRGGDL